MGLFDSKRSKSAINKDRKYFNANEPHEVSYAKSNKRRKKTYDTFDNGGGVEMYGFNVGEKVIVNGEEDEVIGFVTESDKENYDMGYRIIVKEHGTQSIDAVSKKQANDGGLENSLGIKVGDSIYAIKSKDYDELFNTYYYYAKSNEEAEEDFYKEEGDKPILSIMKLNTSSNEEINKLIDFHFNNNIDYYKTYFDEKRKEKSFKNGGGVGEYDRGVVLIKTNQAKNNDEVWDILNEKWSKYDIVNSRAIDLETPYNRGFITDGTLIDVKLLKKDGKYYWDWKAKYAKGGGVGKTYFLFKIKDVNDWDVWQLLRDNSVDSKVMYNGLIVDGYDKKSFRVEKTIKLLDEKGYDYTVKEMQYLAKGGSVDKRDSWHSDRRQFNKSEDWEKPMSQRKNRYDNGGGVGSTQMKYPKHSYDYGGTTMTDENTVRQNLHNGEIHSDILAEIIGRKPNYPNEIVGSIKLEKCFMKPYYRID